MRGSCPLAIIVCLAAGLGCRQAQTFKPARPLPAGTLMIHFTNKVEGPVDLVLDGERIPVTPHKKKVRNLVVSGLAPGSHRYFISSPRDAFGPGRGEVIMPADGGVFLVQFAQHFDAVLYGKPDPAPRAKGIPGITAHMEP